MAEQRLIDANALREGWLEWNPYETIEANTVLYSIDEQPTIDPESLRPVGRWEYKPDMYDNNTYECSECGGAWTIIDGTPADHDMLYCPHCGAKNPESNVGKMEARDNE